MTDTHARLSPLDPKAPPAVGLEERYSARAGTVSLTGLQALVRLPMDQMRADRRAGLNTGLFISGYPGSPLAGYDRELISQRSLLKELNVTYQPGVNEELAATAVMGSQNAGKKLHLRYDGVVGIWYGKAPGLDRAVDAIRHAGFFGVTRHSGALAVVGDDPGCKSSTIPSGSENLFADMAMPVLVPGSVQEVLDLGLHGVAMSRVSSMWVGFKLVTAVADALGIVDVSADRLQTRYPDGPWGIDETIDISFPARIAADREIRETRLPAALRYAAANNLNEVMTSPPGAWLGIIAPNNVYHELLGALRALGLDLEGAAELGIRIYRMGMIYPIDVAAVRRFAEGLEQVLVLEERREFLELRIRDALYPMSNRPVVVGKMDASGRPLVTAYGMLDADAVVEPLRRVIVERLGDGRLSPPPARPRPVTTLPLLARSPYFCAGCPHNTGSKVPAGTSVGSGIGCHGMVGWMDPDRVGDVVSLTQMGGEGAQWVGMAPFVEESHLTQNVGDGTYFHSAQLAVQQAVAAGVDMTFKLLYNAAIAMTGGQDVPGGGQPTTIAATLLQQGVKRVIITTEDVRRYRRMRVPRGVAVWDRSRIIEAQEVLQKTPGVTILIHDQQCAAEARRLRKRGKQPEPAQQVSIVERVCEGCGDCGHKSNCLAVTTIETDFGTKRSVDQTSCNRDYSCLEGDCPSFVTAEPRRRQARRRVRRAHPTRTVAALEVADLPTPESKVTGDEFTVRMPGIGGTGVITASQILAEAGRHAGFVVATMDQTGLAQKGGPVVSDVRISRSPIDRGAKIDSGSADLYLAFDPLVGAAPLNLKAASPDRTVAVISGGVAPLGEMAGAFGADSLSADDYLARIEEVTKPEPRAVVDANAIAASLFGDTTVGNVLLLGVAFQLGALPVAAEDIEYAIKVNGAAVDRNVQAFRWGRMHVIDPARVVSAAGISETPVIESCPFTIGADMGSAKLTELVEGRAADLARYQGEKLARRYVDAVASAVEAVRERGWQQDDLVEIIARNLYKLMAYKDEYEVARLHLEDYARRRDLVDSKGQPMRLYWHLHPPLLRAMGMNRKIRLSRTAIPAFKTLRAMRRLRGTRLDLFGYTKLRRLERALAGEYIDVVRKALDSADSNFATTRAIATLPDIIRGYEQIKIDNVRRYHGELSSLGEHLGIRPADETVALTG